MFVQATTARVVSPADHRRMTEYLKRTRGAERLYVLYLLIRYTGLRISEALAITVGDVWDGYEIRRQMAVRCAKKGDRAKRRTVSLCSKNDRLRTELRAFLNPQGRPLDTQLPLFRTESGQAWHRVNSSKALVAAIRGAGVSPFSWHDLRHSYATELYELTKDLDFAQATLGHEDNRTTRRYIHHGLDRLHQANTNLTT